MEGRPDHASATQHGVDDLQREETDLEGKQFDALTRHLGRQTARRTMIRSAVGGTLALLGIGIVDQASEARNRGNNNRGRRTGFENDECATNDDCLEGLRCQGAKAGIAPGFPTPIAIPVISGKLGQCRYKQGCGGKKNDACKSNNDCCSGDNLTCDNRRCKPDNR
jgi:hypothetical protein